MSRKNTKIYCADFETTSKKQYELEGYTRVYLWKMKGLYNKYNKVGLTIDEFIHECMQFDDKTIIYFHNLSGFDGEFILNYFMENGWKYIRGQELNEGQFTSMTDEFGAHYCIQFRVEGWNKPKIIEFRCSYRLMPISIKKLGELVGLDKLDEEHDYEELKDYKTLDDVPQEELDYIENDVEILKQVLLFLFSMGINKLTMSSSCYASWKQKGGYSIWKEHLHESDEETEEIITKSYKGGICMVNPKYQNMILENVKSYDYNSMYPSQMMGSMPVGKGMTIDASEDYIKEIYWLRDRGYDKYIISVVVDEVEVLDGYIPFVGVTNGFSFSKSYKYERKIKDRKLCLWYDEFVLFSHYYTGRYIVTSITGFKSKKNIFTKYVEYWKDIKEKSNEGDIIRSLAKLMLNSLYGKFGMNTDRLCKEPCGFDEHGKLIYQTAKMKSDTYYYRAIASYITSQARCELIRAIQSCGEDGFIYCDTDSVYCFESVNPEIPLDDHKFNNWKCEGHYHHAKFLKAKVYIKYEGDKKVVRCAGLPNDIAQKYLTFETLHDGFEIKCAKKCKKRVKGGIIIDTTNFKINLDNVIYI